MTTVKSKTLLHVTDNQKHIVIFIRLNVTIYHILASQIASVVESGNLGQLLWRDPLNHDTDDLISGKFSLHRIHVMVREYGCLVLVVILSARRP